ncbi:hypothetical protein ACIPJK_31465 [Streptomyces roseus]|uniref:hypothetical protein n=1 Tax=Streptomyces roseus TaxID=66430 RepID=UPI0038015631
MSADMAPAGPYTDVGGLCEQVRDALEGWALRLLGVHVHRSVEGPAVAVRLVTVVADAAELTVLPGDGSLARAEFHAAAARTYAAAGDWPGVDVRAELVAVRGGCRRPAVALDVPVPVILCPTPTGFVPFDGGKGPTA